MARKNIKLPEDVYERHNERRKEMGLTWEEYIDEGAPEALNEQIREAVRKELPTADDPVGSEWVDMRDDSPFGRFRIIDEETDPSGVAWYHTDAGRPIKATQFRSMRAFGTIVPPKTARCDSCDAPLHRSQVEGGDDGE